MISSSIILNYESLNFVKIPMSPSCLLLFP
jgi:hypothetical protein